MFKAEDIKNLFDELNEELKKLGERGEVGIVGGAVMCLVYNAREATKDIDAVFEPTIVIRKLIKKIADANSLPADWLNDAAKGFIQGNFSRQNVLSLSHLRVWAPEAQYMLAMKCLSARWDSHDRDDVLLLIKHLRLEKPAQVFKLLQNYFPKNKIPPKTQFFIEEVLTPQKVKKK